MFNLKKLARTVVVAAAGLGAAAAIAVPASASTSSVRPGVPIVGVHPGIVRPGLGLRPGIGIGGCGIGSCGVGISSCGLGLGSCGLSTCSTCGLGLGDPIFVSQVPWYGISSASLCDSGCGGLGISTLPSTVFLNGLNGDCAFSAGGALIPGFGGFGFRHHLHGLGLGGGILR